VGLPHPELFRRFRRALGVWDEEGGEEELEVVCWREQFLAILSSGSAAEALGALGRLPAPAFPGGRWLRRPLTIAGLTWYALRDRL